MGDYARRSTDSFWNLAAQLHRGKDFAASVFRNSLAKGKRSDRGLTRLAFERLEERRMLTTYYVDNAVGQNGADSNAGTSLSAPFLTIQKAASIAEPGDVVDILAGTYRETVVPAHSGTATAPITYQPYNGQKVVIDGTNLVSGWTQYSGNIYETSAMNWTMGGQDDQVFVDGQMINYARWPNTSLDVSHPTWALAGANTTGHVNSNGYVVNTIYDPNLTQPAGYWNGATIHVESGQTWVYEEATITSYTRATVNGVSYGVITYTSTYNYDTSFYIAQPGNPYYITGDPYFTGGAFQDLDAPGQFYRDPNSGLLYVWTPNSDSPALHTIEVKQREWGFDLSGDSYIDINGINLFACGINSSATSNNLVINGINAQYVSQFETYQGNWIPTLSNGSDVVGGTGIVLDGAYDTIENSTIAYSAGDGVYLGGNNATVYNNVIHDVDYSGTNASGIDTSEFSSTLISNASISDNTVYNAARTLINVSQLTSSRVDYNQLFNGTLQGVDCGAIYAYNGNGNGTEIDHNYISNMLNNIPGYPSDGIFLDDFCTGFTIDHNVIFDSTEGIKEFEANSNYVYNNTIVNTQTSIESTGETGVGEIANNITNDPLSINYPQATLTVTDNLQSPTNPDFVSPSTGNFQLQSGSPAINAGLVFAPYTNGYVGSAPDLGAYEYGATAWTAGASNAAAAIAAGAIPTPWTASDIGSPTITGNSTYNNGVFVVSGSGSDIWNSADQFQFVDTPTSGNQTIVARVTSQSDTNVWAKAGVMFRESSSASSPFVNVVQTPSNGVNLLWRDASGNLSYIPGVAEANAVWLKLARVGNVFTGYESVDGVNWTTIGSVTIALPAAGLMGLCVTSHDVTQLSTAVFDNVSVLQSAPSAPVISSVTANQVNLTWTAVASATAYQLQRTTDGVNFTAIASLGAVTSYSDSSSLSAGTQYGYRIVATEPLGSTTPSATTFATTLTLPPTSVAATAGPGVVNISWAAAAGAVSYKIYRGTTPGGESTTPLATGITGISYVDTTGIVGTTYYYTVTAVNANASPINAESAASSEVSAAPIKGSIPAPWTSGDVGAPATAGKSTYANGVFTVSGAGSDIWGTSDQFQFVDTPVSGNQTIVARETSQTNTHQWAKAGVMYRESTSASSPFVDVVQTPSNGVNLMWRDASGNLSYIAGVAKAYPVWLKLARVGNVFTGYESVDGVTWTTIGSVTIALPAAGLMGLCVTSLTPAALGTAVFDNVSLVQSAPSAPAITSVSATQVNLTWSAVANASVYQVQRTADGVNYTTIASLTTAQSYTDSIGLSAATQYGYRIIVTDPLGTTPASATTFATTLTLPPTSVLAVAGLGQVSISWAAVAGASSYKIYRGTTPGGESSTPLATGITGLNYVDTTGTFGTTYYYTVTAVNSNAAPLNGESAASKEVSAAPINDVIPAPWTSGDIGGPAIAGNSKYSNGVFVVTGSGIDIWNASDQFQFVDTPTSGDQTVIARVTSQTNTNAWAKAGVMYRQSTSASSPFVDVVQTPGSGVAMQWRDASGNLNWISAAAVNDPVWVKLVRVGNVFTGYDSADGVNWNTIGSVTIALPEAGLTGLCVSSHDPTQLSTADFDNVSVTQSAPSAPAIASVTTNQVNLTWSAVANASAYQVQRTTDGVNFTTIASLAAVTSYTDSSNLSTGTKYGYRIIATDPLGATPASATTFATTLTLPPASVTAVGGTGQVTISWAAATGAVSYKIYRGTAPGGESTTPLATGITGTSYVDTTGVSGTTYYFTVTAVNGNTAPLNGESAASSEVSAAQIIPVKPPTALTAVASTGGIALSWTAGANDTSFNIYRGTTQGGESKTPYATGITGTSYLDAAVAQGSTYYYYVTALSPETTPTAEVSATALIQTAAGDPATNVLASDDVGFESPTAANATTAPAAPWFTWGSAYLSSQYAFMGSQSIAISGSGTNGSSGVGQAYYSITPGVTYTLSVDAMMTAANPLTGGLHGQLNLLFYGASGLISSYAAPNQITLLTSTSASGGPLTGSVGASGWNHYYTTAVAPAGATSVQVGVDTYSSTSTYGGTVYFDNLKFGSVPATPPTALTAVAATGGISLSWTAGSNDSSFNIYRGTTPGGESKTPYATGITGTSYLDAAAAPGVTYYYYVTAVSPETTPTAEVSATALVPSAVGDPTTNLLANENASFESPTAANTTTAPAAPWFTWGSAYLSSQYAYAGTQSIALNGSGSNGNSGAGQAYYSITPGVTYTVSVDAMMTAANPLTGNIVGQLNILFYGANGLISSYASPNQVTVLTSSSATGGALTGSVGSSGWNHYYTSAVAPAGATYVQVGVDTYSTTSTYGGTVYFDNLKFGVATVAAPPTALSAVAGTGGIALSWTAGANDTSFNIYRGTTAGGESTTPYATGITGTSYLDAAVVQGETYYYYVTAVPPETTPTAEVSATALVPAAVGDPTTNLLAGDNASFETPTATNTATVPASPWFTWGSAYLSSQYAYGGLQSIAISGSGTSGSSGVGQAFYSITPGTSYTVSVDGMMTAANPLTGSIVGQLNLLFYGPSGLISGYASPNQVTVLSSTSATGGTLAGSVGNSGWNHFYTSAVAPAGATYVEVGVDTYSSSSTYGGTVYFDNLEFGVSPVVGTAKPAIVSAAAIGVTATSAKPTTTAPAVTSSVAVAPTVASSSAANYLGLKDAALAAVVKSLDTADGGITRAAMLSILRDVQTFNGGVLDANDMSDLKTIVGDAATLNMPGYVQVLASDVISGNTANADYLGKPLGNLAVGSTETHFNNLIDKWFLGTDLPNSGGYAYSTVTGPLYAGGTPSHLDEDEGISADCYLISALGSIADSNPAAIENMIVDNGVDAVTGLHTWTVRFYAGGKADYVTVDNQLPTSSGVLVYDGYGNGTTNPPGLWMALVEKAYAQWNETGNEGRDGTNTYASLTGGWMANVDAQVLGHTANTYDLISTSDKAALISAVTSKLAVTIGTDSHSTLAYGLLGSHAYTVTAYNAQSATFTLYNPWGIDQPTQALTWAQLQTVCYSFATASATGTTSFATSIVVAAQPANALTMSVDVATQSQKLTAAVVDAFFAAEQRAR